MSIILTDRDDRLGANFVSKLGKFINGKINNYKIYYNKDIKYSNSIFIIPFIKLCKININNLKTIVKYYGGIRGNVATPVIQLKQDLISYFKINFKNKFINIIKEELKTKKFKLPWKNNKNIIAIHLRCDDRYNWSDYDGRGTANYIRNLIETNTFDKYNRKKMFSVGKDTQVCINPYTLLKYILIFKKKYPKKEIHIIYYGKIPKKIQIIINNLNIKLHSNNNPDYDLWLLINSDILFLSKSLFSIIAGYLHKGTKVYYPIWGVFTAHGLYTKYDKSNWISYI